MERPPSGPGALLDLVEAKGQGTAGREAGELSQSTGEAQPLVEADIGRMRISRLGWTLVEALQIERKHNADLQHVLELPKPLVEQVHPEICHLEARCAEQK